MYIKNIKLNNFRNYKEKNIELSDGINIFYGDNANGKTNIVESMYICCIGKSFRAKKDAEMVLIGEELGKVEVELDRKGTTKNIEFLITKNNKKQIKVNGIKLLKISELFGNLNVVLFSPEDIEFVKGEPSFRRRFFDLLISQIKPYYMGLLQEYYKNLEQKNTLLKSHRKPTDIELDIWDEKLAELNIKIKEIRRNCVDKINPFLAKYIKEISQGKENSVLVYKTQLEDKKQDVLKKIKEKRQIDLDRGFSSVGVHRDDYKIKINNLEIERFGSQGQIKTAIIALKLAERDLIEESMGEKPILLLDDVMSELDNKRREYIAEKINDCQVVITCTDINDLLIKKAKTFKIEKNA